MLLDGITIGISEYLLHLPPLLPNNEIVFILFFFAVLSALRIFGLFPDVELQINKSPLVPKASSCLLKTVSKPKSFPIADSMEVSVVSAIALSGFLSFLNLPTNSAAICWLSAALPPLPAKKTVLLFFSVLTTNFDEISISFINFFDAIFNNF